MKPESTVMSTRHTLQSLRGFGISTLRGMYLSIQVERDELREALQAIVVGNVPHIDGKSPHSDVLLFAGAALAKAKS